jgi:hypothetical protein
MLTKTANISASTGQIYGHRRQCAAALKAIMAAKLYLKGKAKTLQEAADDCGVNVSYVAAAVAVVKFGDLSLEKMVLDGITPLLVAAAWVKPAVQMTEVFKRSSAHQRVMFAQAVRPEVLFDTVTAAL